MQKLRSRTAKALAWNLSGTGGRLATQLLVQICLARLLLPAEFGLMAMLMVVTSIGQVFVDGGFGTALVHQKDATREEESSILYVNVGLSLAVFSFLWYLAPYIAEFYEQQAIKPLLRFTSAGLVIGALGIVQSSILSRNLDFKSVSIVNLLTGALSGGIAIAMALRGYGVWCLAWQFLLNSAFRTILLWMVSTWRPLFTFRLSAIRRMGPYGSRLVASNLISAVFENLNQLLIGKFYTATDLGYYQRAQTMQSIPVNTLSQAIGGVCMPAFVHLNDDLEKFKNAYRQAIRYTMAAAVPMMTLLCIVANPLFTVLLSPKWASAVPYFQLFCLSGIVYPLHLLNINSLLALGKTDIYLRIELTKRILAICGAAIALPFGVMAFAQSTVVVSFLCLGINTHYTKKLIGYPLSQQVGDIFSSLLITSAAGVITVVALNYLPTSPLISLSAGSTIFVIVYGTSYWFLNKEIVLNLIQSLRTS